MRLTSAICPWVPAALGVNVVAALFVAKLSPLVMSHGPALAVMVIVAGVRIVEPGSVKTPELASVVVADGVDGG